MDRFRIELAPGEWLFRQGDAGDCAYIIESGEIDIVIDDAGGHAQPVARLHARDVFGEMALAGESRRSAGAVAAAPTTLLVITAEHLRERLKQADPLLRHLLRTVSARCRSLLDELYGRKPDTSAIETADAAASDRDSAYTRLSTERRLAMALERDELALYYQPIVRCSDGRIDGFEALIRWPQPDGSFLSPAEFVPLAEMSGLIVPIGRWIIEKGAAALARFTAIAGRPIYVSVNLSALQFGDPKLLPSIRNAIMDNALAAKQLTLEVTESLLIERLDRAVSFLDSCREAGTKISVDDFGTGYSSISYLHRLPADVLKLDRAFVRDATNEQALLKVVRAITALAHDLGLMVVQEGIETQAQAERAAALGIDWGQGYYYSKPLPYERALACFDGGTAGAPTR
jgi:EAL domain-containing protein (putative c-di-GMP-specific phosphodiesterase class I)